MTSNSTIQLAPHRGTKRNYDGRSQFSRGNQITGLTKRPRVTYTISQDCTDSKKINAARLSGLKPVNGRHRPDPSLSKTASNSGNAASLRNNSTIQVQSTDKVAKATPVLKSTGDQS